MDDSTETETAGQRSKKLRSEMLRSWRGACHALSCYNSGNWWGRFKQLAETASKMEGLVEQGHVPESLLEPIIDDMAEAVSVLNQIWDLAESVNPSEYPRLKEVA